MIIDTLENAHRYVALNPGFAGAMAFLARPDLKALPEGTYAIDGERVYATISREQGREKGEAPLEVHEKYIDIQLVLDGTDTMGWKPRAWCKEPTGDFDRAADIQFFAGEAAAWVPVESGAFAVFFPDDAHIPLVSPGRIHKVVVKVLAAL